MTTSTTLSFDPVPAGTWPELRFAAYRSTARRGPVQAPLRVRDALASSAVPRFSASVMKPLDADLTAQGAGAPLGEKIVVTGRVTDEDGRAVRDSLVEVWQCNSAGRYFHSRDQHDAPLDPNFHGHGKFTTDADGRYRFVTIKPGPYPWGNHPKAWRPAHIHFSLFGNVLAQRLVTQMYFAGDPLFAYDPIYQSIPDLAARERLCARLSMDETVGEEMLGYVFDIVLRGRGVTPFGL
jgi:protocatechuate 3,4-dioxygenase beta subunit